MSKKKGKATVKPAAKKKNRPVKAAANSRRPRIAQASTTTGGTSQITIFLFRTSSGNRIRTSPQRAFANPGGHLEWTVVNMIDGTDVPVRITWPDRSPFAAESVEFKSWQRESLQGVKAGVYKYVVHAYDTQEDPEIEIPDL